jgi:hypothetical protein
MVLWYRIMGWFFMPFGLYFAMLVNPVGGAVQLLNSVDP